MLRLALLTLLATISIATAEAEWAACESVGVELDKSMGTIEHVLIVAAPRTVVEEVVGYLQSQMWTPVRPFNTPAIEPGSGIIISQRGNEVGGLWVGAEYVCFYQLAVGASEG